MIFSNNQLASKKCLKVRKFCRTFKYYNKMGIDKRKISKHQSHEVSRCTKMSEATNHYRSISTGSSSCNKFFAILVILPGLLISVTEALWIGGCFLCTGT